MICSSRVAKPAFGVNSRPPNASQVVRAIPSPPSFKPPPGSPSIQRVPAATKRKIFVTNTPDVLTDTTADFAFALLMAGARRVVEGHQFVHSGEWNKWSIDLLLGQDVHHSTLGIFGLGRIGQAVARRGRGFSMRILYHDAVRAPEAVERELGAELVSAERLLRESDFVSLHVPLSAETRHLIGAAQLRLMKKTAILVNSSRGPVVDEPALAAALQEGVIAGAALDVFEHEPKVHPTLLKLPNVVVAPHIASVGGHSPQNVHDGGGECGGRDRGTASAKFIKCRALDGRRLKAKKATPAAM